MEKRKPASEKEQVLVGLGRAVSAGRAARNMTVEEAAASAEVPPELWSSIERGEQDPGVVALSRIAKTLGTYANTLLE